MIFQSFILGNLVSLCMKIINSVVVVGLYYGFLTTFSIGPSYLFLLRARVMEEGTEKKVSATIGFITGQLMMFISIYYVPLHLALGRPHTITVLALPYLLFHFFWNNHKHFFDYRSTNRNSMRNLSIQCVFLNNLIFQLFNHFILPSSMLVRLVNIFMFRCNNKMLFVTSSFVGWLIGHILFMKWLRLVLVWIQQNNSIRSNKYLVSELRNLMARIFSIILFITCVYYLGRIPSPILTKKLKETSERGESKEETDVEIETTSETKGTKQEQEGSTEEDPSPSLFSEEKEDPDKIDEREEIRVNGKQKTKDEFLFKETRYKNIPIYETYYLNVGRNQENSKLEIFKEKIHLRNFRFQKPFVAILFDYKSWTRPGRYLKIDRFDNSITLKNEMSQYFFHTCQSAGKERISFTHPPSLSTFFEMIERKTSLFTIGKLSYNENKLENRWSYNNKEKRKNITNLFLDRVKTIDKILESNSLILDGLENRNRLCKYCNNYKYLPTVYDPLLKGASRGRMLKLFWLSIKEKISLERGWINRIYGVFIIINYFEFQKKKKKNYRIDKKSLEKEILFLVNLINEFYGKPTSNLKKNYLLPESKQVRINSEVKKKKLFENIQAYPNTRKLRKQLVALKEIKKKVPRWSHKLINNLEQEEEQNENPLKEQPPVRSRKSKRVVIFNDNLKDSNTASNPEDIKKSNDEPNEITVIRYSQRSDFRRDIIAGSIRAQRRKTIICKAFEANIHSPTFLDRIEKDPSFFFAISEPIKKKIKKWMWKNTEFQIIDYTEKKTKESTKQEKANKIKDEKRKRREKLRIEIYESWDSFVVAQVIRGLMLVTQSILRKYIKLPSLIIVKNIARILLFQPPEWAEDLTDWRKEMHIKCTYNAVPFSEIEFPKNWLKDGIQIKILSPFRLKPWHKSKLRERYTYPLKNNEQNYDFFFLTVLGKETDLPCGTPRKPPSFFDPIFEELNKKLKKWKKICFRVIKILKEKFLFFLNVAKEKMEALIKNIIFRKNQIKKLKIIHLIPFFRLKEIEIYELSENKKERNFIRNNEIIHESSINIQSTNCTSCALTKQKIQGLAARTSTMVNEIQKISKDNKKEFRSLPINISSNKMSYDDKRVESPKTFWLLLKKRKVRLIRKTKFLLNFFVERIHRNILLYINNISRINVQLLFYFFETKNKINKKNSYTNYIYNNETNQEKTAKTNQNITQIFYTITESLFYISNKKLHSFCDLFYLSQAYVFYKLSQNTDLNFFFLYKLRLRSVFQSNVTSLFLKNEIKNFFIETQKILHSELNHKNLRNFRTIHQYKNGLKNYYQDNLSQFIPQESRNRANRHSIIKKTHNKKDFSYAKNLLIYVEKQKKQDRYALLSYNFIKSEAKNNSYISALSLQVNYNPYLFSNYDESKHQSFNTLIGIMVKNSLVEDNIIHIKKNKNRKIFNWVFLNFFFIKKNEIRVWRNMDTNTDGNKYTKSKTNNYKKMDEIENQLRFFPTIPQNKGINPSKKKKKIFDWMRMNGEILNRSTVNLQIKAFPEFWILCNSYKIKPWAIPIKLLLLNWNENVSENKKTPVKKKIEIFKSIFSLKKQKEKECTVHTDFESTLLNYEKAIEENYVIQNLKKVKKKKLSESETDRKIDELFFPILKRLFLFQLRWNDFLNKRLMKNIIVYCLLLRLLNPREITIGSIQRGEMGVGILKIPQIFNLPELLQNGIFFIEPLRLSLKRAAPFIMHHTMDISIFHNSNHTINQRSREKSLVDKKNSDELIPKPQKMTENVDKTYYNLFVPESILSPRRRREFRILICFDSSNRNLIPLNAPFWAKNQVKSKVLNKRKRETNTLIKLKLFIWPNYRLEDFACMNRYWFDTNNGSRFSLLRIHLYARFEK
nr:Ycf1 protein [Girardinia diversifolia]